MAGDGASAEAHKRAALAAAEQIDKQEDRALLLADLQTLELESRVP